LDRLLNKSVGKKHQRRRERSMQKVPLRQVQ